VHPSLLRTSKTSETSHIQERQSMRNTRCPTQYLEIGNRDARMALDSSIDGEVVEQKLIGQLLHDLYYLSSRTVLPAFG